MKPLLNIYLITFLAGVALVIASVVLLTGSTVTTSDYVLAAMGFLLFLTIPGVAFIFKLLSGEDKLLLDDFSI